MFQARLRENRKDAAFPSLYLTNVEIFVALCGYMRRPLTTIKTFGSNGKNRKFPIASKCVCPQSTQFANADQLSQ